MPEDDPKQRCSDIKLAKKQLNWIQKLKGMRVKKTISYFENLLRDEKMKLKKFFVWRFNPDSYSDGLVHRVSPEAPIPALKVLKKTNLLWAYGNVDRFGSWKSLSLNFSDWI